jgi:hypothetical protein
LTTPLHRILSDAVPFQFLTPSVCRSCWTLSNHLTGGLPFVLFPIGLLKVSFLQGLSSSVLQKCLSHLSPAV